MNDVLYRLYSITADPKHLLLAHLFDKPCFLGLLAVKADDLSGFHTNTHIPIVIGSQMRYEITGDPIYKEIGTYFMDIVNTLHAYVIGGTSVSEFWSDPKRLASTLQTENEESCTTYNMLKITLRQSVDPVGSQDNRLLVTITITSNQQSSSVSSTLHLRVPIWTNASGSKASLNGEAVSLPPPVDKNGDVSFNAEIMWISFVLLSGIRKEDNSKVAL
nr:E3 ubiquitin-protein like [Ipomoea batatas]